MNSPTNPEAIMIPIYEKSDGNLTTEPTHHWIETRTGGYYEINKPVGYLSREKTNV